MLLDIIPYVMDIITVVQANSSSPGARNPLLPRTASPQQVPAKNVRRKGSFVRPADSSEESPMSSNNSIFEAFVFSNSNSEDSVFKSDTLPPFKQTVREISPPNDENMKQPSTSTRSEPTINTEFLYGHGTILGTITEQKSYGTMRSIARTKSADDISTVRSISRAKSADDISTTPLLGHRDSFIIARTRPGHKQSFSLDDIWSIQDSYHDACAMIDQAARRRLSIHEVYAKPQEPLIAPPERPDTPPGCPSWTEAQRPGPRQHLMPAHTRLQRLLRMPSSGMTLSSMPSRSFFTGRIVSAPGLTRLPPRFRVPKSVYSAIETHPFSSAPVHKIDSEPPVEAPRPVLAPVATEHPRTSSIPSAAPIIGPKSKGKGKGKSKFVRFTPSATARDSEMVNLRLAMEVTSSTALHPLVDHPWSSQPVPYMKITCPHRKGRHLARINMNRRLNSPMNPDIAPLSNPYLPLASTSSLPRLTLTPSIRGVRPMGDSFPSLHASPHSLSRNSITLDNSNTPGDRDRRISISPSLLSDFNLDFTSRDDIDLGIIDLEHENRTSIHTRDTGTPLISRPASACTSMDTSNGYFMSGALYSSEGNVGAQAVNVPIMTGARMMDVVSPALRMDGDRAGGCESERGEQDWIERQRMERERVERKDNADESVCWKCRLIAAKRKVEDWFDESGHWFCFVCCGGIEEGWEEERGEERCEENGAIEREAERRRRNVLGGVPGVGL